MANITVTLYWDMDLRKWTTTLGGTTETDPIQGLVQGDIVKFAVRFVQTGVAVVLAAPVFTASGIKADNDFTGSYLIQLSAPVLSDTTLYTFTVNPLNSAQLNTFLQTYRNTWCALEIYDSVNGILTTPLELQIMPGYSLSGTPTDNVAGVIAVAAGKTVTFPQSLTFPSALGTNGFQLTTDGAGALTWAASGALTDGDKGEITVSNSGAQFTIDNDVVTLAKLAHMPTARVIGRTTGGTGSPELLTISGTGSVAMTNTPTLVTPVLGDATGTSIVVSDSVSVSGANGYLEAGGVNGFIEAIGTNAYVSTRTIRLFNGSQNTILAHSAATSEKTATFPNVTGTVAVAATSATDTQALFATATAGAPAYRGIATADIATALTTPGAIGGTTPNTGAFTTLTSSNTTDSTTTATGAVQTLGGLGVAKSIFAGGNINIPATTSTAGQITQAGTRLLHTFTPSNQTAPADGTNTWVGQGAGNFALLTNAGNNYEGCYNVAVGKGSLVALTTGFANVAVGNGCGTLINSGYYNSIIGDRAGTKITNGFRNLLFGSIAGSEITTGASNLVFGHYAGALLASGGSNLFFGPYGAKSCGGTISSGSNNVFLGVDSDGTNASNQTGLGMGTTTAGSYSTAVGSGATCTAANQVMLGRSTEIVTLPGGLVTVPVEQTATTAAVSVAVTTTALTTTAPAQAITLANGTNGQIKIITHIASSGGGTAVLTPATSAADYNTITFSSVGDTATLQYHTTGGWYILSLRGAVAA